MKKEEQHGRKYWGESAGVRELTNFKSCTTPFQNEKYKWEHDR